MSKTNGVRILNFRRANSRFWQDPMGDCPSRQRIAQKSWLIFKDSLLKAQEESIHFAEEWAWPSVGEEKTPNYAKCRKEAYRKSKQGWAALGEYGNNSKACKDGVRKANAHLRLKLEVIWSATWNVSLCSLTAKVKLQRMWAHCSMDPGSYWQGTRNRTRYSVASEQRTKFGNI